MTTKHVVADEAFGLLARRMWELKRRVLEGSIPVEDALDSLQGIIEGHAETATPASDSAQMKSALVRIQSRPKRNPADVLETEIGKRYFTKYCCGERMLQVKVFLRHINGKRTRCLDEMLCTTCYRSKEMLSSY